MAAFFFCCICNSEVGRVPSMYVVCGSSGLNFIASFSFPVVAQRCKAAIRLGLRIHDYFIVVVLC